jgi:anthranilate phosphoribosyltransferase
MQEVLLTPEDFGVSSFDPELLRGGDKHRNAELTRQVLGGEPVEDVNAQRVAAIRLSVAVNAAAALVAADAVLRPEIAQTVPLAERINNFLPQTTQALGDSSAWNVVLGWIEISRKVAQR